MFFRTVFTSYSRRSKLPTLRRAPYSCKIPTVRVPSIPKEDTTINSTNLDSNTISLLERLSLVKCDTAEGVKILEDSITFANQILYINTDNVEPLYSVLENQNLPLRPDIVTQGNCQKDVLKNAALKEDDYFVAPPGNIPLHEVEGATTTKK